MFSQDPPISIIAVRQSLKAFLKAGLTALVDMHINILGYLYTDICVNKRIYIYIYICIFVCVYTYLICIYVCIYIYIDIDTFVCISADVYAYTHTHTRLSHLAPSDATDFVLACSDVPGGEEAHPGRAQDGGSH